MNHVTLHWTELKPSPLNQVMRDPGMDEDAILELAESIRSQGIIEPLVVIGNGDGYQIVSGERRWRAAKALGDQAPPLPCLVRDPMGRLEQLVLMGVENLQRQDMNPIAEARYYANLLEEAKAAGKSIDESWIARQTGKRTGHVKERLRLLGLHPALQEAIAQGSIPLRSEPVLRRLGYADQEMIAGRVVGKSIAQIRRAVETILARHERELANQVAGENRRPALTVEPRGTVSEQGFRLAVRATCGACEASREIRSTLRWEAVQEAANGQCRQCEVRDIQEACALCPLVDFLRILRRVTQEDKANGNNGHQ